MSHDIEFDTVQLSVSCFTNLSFPLDLIYIRSSCSPSLHSHLNSLIQHGFLHLLGKIANKNSQQSQLHHTESNCRVAIIPGVEAFLSSLKNGSKYLFFKYLYTFQILVFGF